MKIKRIDYTSSQKKHVAAYCRVSTDQDGQKDSFETQKQYYGSFIATNPDWEMVSIYADEGKSGTSAKHRPQFMQMIKDAYDGKIDIILTKSISRFARNVVDCQRYVRDLKSRGIEVRFEREGISSMDASADFIFSMLAMVAQEESRSISENVRWRYAKNFEQGDFRLGSNRILGYDADENGKLTPNDDAWIIKRVFDNFLAGMNYTEIAADLDAAGARRLRSDRPYTAERVRRILQNEYYVGDMILQKTPPRDFLTKKPKHDEYTSYYVKNAHGGIVDRETWDQVKLKLDTAAAEIASGLFFNCTQTHFLYGKLFCKECGAPYTRRTYTDRKGNHYKAWNCRQRQKGKKGNGCKNSSMREESLFAEIASALELERLDRRTVDGLIDRIMITPDRIQVQIKTDNNENPDIICKSA